MVLLTSLPSALQDKVIGYLSVHVNDRLSLALTCRTLLDSVETFSKNELHRICTEFKVDDDFMFRVGAHAAAMHFQRTVEEDGDLGGPQWVTTTVSHRRMLRCSYQTHIYSLITDSNKESSGIQGLALHPNGKLLLSGVRLWDIPNRRLVDRNFEGHERYVDCAFLGGYVVSMSSGDSSVRIWNAHDGSSRHVEQYDGMFLEFAVAISSGEIFYCDEGHIVAINAYTLSKRESRGFEWLENAYVGNFSLIGNHLLILVHDPYEENEERDDFGIYIVDVVTLEQVGGYAGDFRGCSCSEEGLLVVESDDGRRLNVYQLNERDASMFPVRSIMRHDHRRIGGEPKGDILLVNDSKVYISAWATDPPFCTIDVYDTRNGSFLRSLCCPLDGQIWVPVRLVAGSKLLFCGFNSTAGRRHVRGTIKAYLLE